MKVFLNSYISPILILKTILPSELQLEKSVDFSQVAVKMTERKDVVVVTFVAVLKAKNKLTDGPEASGELNPG